MSATVWIWTMFLTAGVLLLSFWQYSRSCGRCLLFSFASGIGTLAFVFLLQHFVPIRLSITPFTLGASVLFGPPGVITMLLIPLI